MNDRDTLAVIMPSYNEEGAIEALLDKWCGVLSSLDIDYKIHVYDASKDRTPEILDKMSAANNRIIVHHMAKIGHGPTLVAAYLENTESTWLFQMDSDDEMDCSGFAELWNRRNGYDFVVGYREGRENPLSRRFITMTSRLTIRLFYGRGVVDVNSPYRLLRTKSFTDFRAILPEKAIAPNVLMSGWVAKRGLRYLELPVHHEIRKTGVAINGWPLLKAAIKSFSQAISFSFK